eukprot:scaffold18668_cov164-Amphora_coffeaeformis.AAC.6
MARCHDASQLHITCIIKTEKGGATNDLERDINIINGNSIQNIRQLEPPRAHMLMHRPIHAAWNLAHATMTGFKRCPNMAKRYCSPMAPPGKKDTKYHNKAMSWAALDAITSAYPETPPN